MSCDVLPEVHHQQLSHLWCFAVFCACYGCVSVHVRTCVHVQACVCVCARAGARATAPLVLYALMQCASDTVKCNQENII